MITHSGFNPTPCPTTTCPSMVSGVASPRMWGGISRPSPTHPWSLGAPGLPLAPSVVPDLPQNLSFSLPPQLAAWSLSSRGPWDWWEFPESCWKILQQSGGSWILTVEGDNGSYLGRGVSEGRGKYPFRSLALSVPSVPFLDLPWKTSL